VYRVFLDIETLPPPEEDREKLPVERVRKLLRKRGAAPAEGPCTEEEFRGLSLHGEFGRVLCVGLIVERDGHVVHHGVLGRDRSTLRFHLDERRTLRGLWRLLQDFNTRRDLIVGHNVFWDAKFLCKRSRVLGVRQPKLCFAKYRSQPLYDTMAEWCSWDGQAISLDDLAAVLQLGMEKGEGLSGAKVYDAFLAGEHQRIADYCFQDVELARAVYYRLEYPELPTPAPLRSLQEAVLHVVEKTA
jgi:3'-5' exonuclease